jgi:NAD(P)-dependent dehydrogenase (short-subunit alcohol dehydrogenase family)
MSISLTSFSSHIRVVVVGATGGIGRALVEHLLSNEQVDTVVGMSRGVATVKHRKYQHYLIDYNNEGSLVLAATHISEPVDIVLVATGFLHDEATVPEKSFKQLSHDNMMKYMLLNTIGPSLVAKHLLPKMRSTHKAVFAPLSARVGSISDNRLGGWYAYRASKAALNMMVKTLAIEMQRRQANVIITSLHPGTVDTALSAPFQRNVEPEKLFTREFSAQCLLNVINQLESKDSGYCIAWDGKRISE